jgi:hypothetical protein
MPYDKNRNPIDYKKIPLQKPAYQLLYGIKKKELSTVFYDKTGIAPKYQAGLPISENTKTVGKNIDAPWIACIELVGL